MPASKMHKLYLKVHDGELAVGKIQTVEGEAPAGDLRPSQPVPQGVIGHWIDVADAEQNVLYRRFLHNVLPFHLTEVVPKWSQRRRTRTRFVIELPAIEGAAKLELFEQSLNSAAHSETKKRCYASIDLTRYRV